MEETIPTKEFIDGLGKMPYMLDYLKSKARFNVNMWHRGARKTAALLNKLIVKANRPDEVGLYWYIGPYLNQAIATVWTDPNTSIFRWIPPEMLKKCHVDNGAHSIKFPSGSFLQIKGADKPSSLRGPKPKGVGVDEYGEIARRHGAELREAVLEPAIRSSGGWIDYCGTPTGMNDFAKLMARKGDYKPSLITVEDSGIYTEEELEQIKENAVNEDFFYQEYFCRIIEGASSVFKGVRKCVKGELEQPKRSHEYLVGIDLGRTTDATVIVVFDRNTNHLVFYKRLENTPWEEQKLVINTILKTYNNATAVVDATGVGDSFVESLGRMGLNIQSVKINSNQVKRALIERLATYIENQYLSFPELPEVLHELAVFEYQITKNNALTYSAPHGEHDDIVMALALAISRLDVKPRQVYVPDSLNVLKTHPRTGYLA